MNDFSQRIAQLSADKRALLDGHLKQKQLIGQRSIPRLPRSGQTQSFPVSFAEQRLWFLDQWQPASPLYNIARAYKLEGIVDISALERSVRDIVKRHESLRTSFSTDDGEPVRVIHPSADLRLAFTDLSGSPEDRREAEAREVVVADAQTPFDLSIAPLLRVRLLRLAANKHAMLIAVHHIVSDGWSMDVFLRDLGELYAAYSRGLSSVLPGLPIQYADYAVWQRQWLQEKELADSQTAYWKKKLAGAPSLLELPYDRPRAALQSFDGARQTRMLPKRLVDSLKMLSRRAEATLFMTLLAAFQILLSRYSGSDDIATGTPIAGRLRAETENLIGFFVNTIVLRTDLSGDPSFVELISRVRETCLQAYAHQDLPFESLVEELNPERSLSYSPLFQVMFALQNVNAAPLTLADVEVTPLELKHATAKFDLSLVLAERGGGLRLVAEHNTDLFDPVTITRLLSHYQTLLEGIVADPEQRLSALPMLTAAEKQQLLIEWNDTTTDYPNDRCVQQLFEQQADTTPDAIAVVFPSAGSGQADRQSSYQDLNIRANRLAHHLIALGVGPGVVVALCVERSLEMIVALLGILKAGGAYLPLDPAHPKERLAFMLEDSQAKLVITDSRLNDELPAHPAQCIFIDQAAAFERSPVTNPHTAVTADHLAYVIYTSGSTGRPKGVCIPHRALTNLLCAMRDETAIAGNDTLLAVTTLSFDIAALELYLPLISGARLILASREDAADGTRLAGQLRDSEATAMQATPATWRLLIESGWQGDGRLNLLCGGEVLSRELADQLLDRSLTLTNLYGPTETTVWSTMHRVAPDRHAIPLGRPLANTQVYILDPNLNPVPIGVPGELHIGGAGLARGYLNRPELTAEKFIPHPFSEEAGARLYKTGDLARYLADGNIEFLGRIDHQVKIRGFRIELGEIEAVLNQHTEVKACAVIASEDTAGDKRLVAYVIGEENSLIASADLRDFLRRKLPEYMIPATFVVLDKLPVTPNGKLDRKALPAPDAADIGVHGSFIAPRTPNEEKLAAIFAKVLKIDRIGIHDNFFELGGHSLLATQLISRVRAAFAIDLPLRSLFEGPTVADLASVIAHKLMENMSAEEMAELLNEVEALQ